LANGDVAATRRLAGQATKITRASHDVTYDPVNDEMVVAAANAQAILTFRGGANGDEAPIRILQGPSTQMVSPGYGNTVDAVHNELFVVEREYVLVFPRAANGDAAPLRVIRGPDTLLKNARSVAVDPVHNVLVVGTGNGILIFNRTDNGNVKPRGVIRGPKAGIATAPQNFRVNSSKGLIVAVRGGRGDDDDDGGRTADRIARQAAEEGRRGRGRRLPREIAVWSINDNGDVPPLFALSSPMEVQGARVALNPSAKEVIIGGRLWVEVYSFPEIF
jgi:hypothetical protein